MNVEYALAFLKHGCFARFPKGIVPTNQNNRKKQLDLYFFNRYDNAELNQFD